MPTEPFQPKDATVLKFGTGRPLKGKGSQKTGLNDPVVSVDQNCSAIVRSFPESRIEPISVRDFFVQR